MWKKINRREKMKKQPSKNEVVEVVSFNDRDLIGKKIGKLTIVKSYRVVKSGRKRIYYNYICECGNESKISRDRLLNKKVKVKSCGCYREIHDRRKGRHGMSNTRFYNIWVGIKKRTLNKNRKEYLKYGGRGIMISDSWMEFINFHGDMYSDYLKHVKEHGEKNTTIDRINPDGDYERENCRWATYSIQNKNKDFSRIRKVRRTNQRKFKATNIKTGEEFTGYSQAEFARSVGISPNHIGSVLSGKRKWTEGYTFKYIDEG